MIRPFKIHIGDRQMSMLLDIEPGRYFSDHALAHYLNSNQCPEPEVVHVLFRALKAGDCAVDAGANVGFFTVMMSKLVGPTGHVIAVEPDSRNLEMLRKNLDINECKNVEVIEKPLSSDTREVLFCEHEENGQSFIFEKTDCGPSDSSSILTTTTLTEIIGDRGPVLLKMDIEGAEYEAMKGCEHFFPYVISEVNPEALKRADSSPEELITELSAYGIPCVLRADGTLPAMLQPSQKVRIARPNTNMLFTMGKLLAGLWPEVEL